MLFGAVLRRSDLYHLDAGCECALHLCDLLWRHSLHHYFQRAADGDRRGLYLRTGQWKQLGDCIRRGKGHLCAELYPNRWHHLCRSNFFCRLWTSQRSNGGLFTRNTAGELRRQQHNADHNHVQPNGSTARQQSLAQQIPARGSRHLPAALCRPTRGRSAKCAPKERELARSEANRRLGNSADLDCMDRSSIWMRRTVARTTGKDLSADHFRIVRQSVTNHDGQPHRAVGEASEKDNRATYGLIRIASGLKAIAVLQAAGLQSASLVLRLNIGRSGGP